MGHHRIHDEQLSETWISIKDEMKVEDGDENSCPSLMPFRISGM
jgi:hypothetical protein